MKQSWAHLDKYRVLTGAYASRPRERFGAFRLGELTILASCGEPEIPWEHVSVSRQDRCPTWAEMDKIKRMFWNNDEAVIQLHVPRSQHVNVHPNCLHLWRPIDVAIPLPPMIAV